MAPPLRQISQGTPLFLLCFPFSSSLMLHKKRWNPALVPHSIAWRGTLGWYGSSGTPLDLNCRGQPPERPWLPSLTEVCSALGWGNKGQPWGREVVIRRLLRLQAHQRFLVGTRRMGQKASQCSAFKIKLIDDPWTLFFSQRILPAPTSDKEHR